VLNAGKWIREHEGMKLRINRALRDEEIDRYRGPKSLCEERWIFWRTMLGELAGRNDLQEETRRWASRAEQYMSTLA